MWMVSQADDTIGKEDLAQRLGWSSSKLNDCLARALGAFIRDGVEEARR